MAKPVQSTDGSLPRVEEKFIADGVQASTDFVHGDGLFPVQDENGLLESNGKVVEDATPGMSVRVLDLLGLIDGFKVGNKNITGVVAQTVVITAADGSNPRIDSVVMGIAQDTDNKSVNESDPTKVPMEVIAGAPAATPVAPAIPDGKVLLANVTVGTGVTSIVDANIDNSVKDFLIDVDKGFASVSDQITAIQDQDAQLVADVVTLRNRVTVLEQAAEVSGIDTKAVELPVPSAWDVGGSSNILVDGNGFRLTGAVAGNVLFKRNFDLPSVGEVVEDGLFLNGTSINSGVLQISSTFSNAIFTRNNLTYDADNWTWRGKIFVPTQISFANLFISILSPGNRSAVVTIQGSPAGTATWSFRAIFGGVSSGAPFTSFSSTLLNNSNTVLTVTKAGTNLTATLSDGVVTETLSITTGLLGGIQTRPTELVLAVQNTQLVGVTFDDIEFNDVTGGFNSPGVIVSDPFTTTDDVRTLAIAAATSLPAGTTILAEYSTDNGVGWDPFPGVPGAVDLPAVEASPTTLYRLTLSTTDVTKTPTISSIVAATDNAVEQADALAIKSKVNAIITAAATDLATVAALPALPIP